MHTKRGLLGGRQGEIATILTVASLVVMAVGLFLGATRKPDSTRSKAAEDCLYNATAQVVKDTKTGPLLTLAENNGKGLSVENDWKQGGPFIDTELGYQYNFTQNPFTFGLYDNPDTGSVTLKGLDTDVWNIKGIFCTPQTPEALGCELGVRTLDKITIDNFSITCGVHIKYGWIVESKLKAKTTPALTVGPTVIIPSPTSVFNPIATSTPTSTPSATPRLTPIVFPYKSPTPIASATPRATTTPIHTPTNTPSPIPTNQQAMCNTAVTAGKYNPDADVKFWEMGSRAGTVYLSYGMYKKMDKLEITHDDIDVFHTNGFVEGSKSNIEIIYSPKATTKLKATLTSSRSDLSTIWWYALSCPRDPIPTTALCTNAAPVKSISGSIKLDPQISEICKNNDCVVTVSLEQNLTGKLVRQVRGPLYEYSFGTVKVEPGTHVMVDKIDIPNRPQGINEATIPSNCFGSRKIREHDTACGIDMSKEVDCRATEVDFIITNFGRQITVPQNPLRVVDINNDRRINIIDLGLVLKEFGSKAKGIAADINRDGVVNSIDVARVIGNLSKSVPVE